jgi:hypothetical protein
MCYAASISTWLSMESVLCCTLNMDCQSLYMAVTARNVIGWSKYEDIRFSWMIRIWEGPARPDMLTCSYYGNEWCMSVTIELNTSEQHHIGMYSNCAPHYVHMRVALQTMVWIRIRCSSGLNGVRLLVLDWSQCRHADWGCASLARPWKGAPLTQWFDRDPS